MSNIAGKAYAMNLVTPLSGASVLANKLIFRMLASRVFRERLDDLLTLSMIHCARWVILRPQDFPHLSEEQPREALSHGTMLFFSNFNGSWEQYVDAFSAAAPSGPDLLWYVNAGWPRAVSEPPFHRQRTPSPLWTDYFYSAYPLAEAGDLKAARRVKRALGALVEASADATPEQFQEAYEQMLAALSDDLTELDESPVEARGPSARERSVVGLAGGSLAPRRREPSLPTSSGEDEAEISAVTEIAREDPGEAREPSAEHGRQRRAR